MLVLVGTPRFPEGFCAELGGTQGVDAFLENMNISADNLLLGCVFWVRTRVKNKTSPQ